MVSPSMKIEHYKNRYLFRPYFYIIVNSGMSRTEILSACELHWNSSEILAGKRCDAPFKRDIWKLTQSTTFLSFVLP